MPAPRPVFRSVEARLASARAHLAEVESQLAGARATSKEFQRFVVDCERLVFLLRVEVAGLNMERNAMARPEPAPIGLLLSASEGGT